MNSVTIAREIDIWCNKAYSLEKRLSDAAHDLQYLSKTYPEMRDKCSDLEKEKYDAAKERIDSSYGNLIETKRYLCELQAGGRRHRKTRRGKPRVSRIKQTSTL
jgi:hypothetical protein